VTFLTMHLNPDHESCPNLRGELAAGRKSLCLSSPDRGRSVERPLVTTGQSSWELTAVRGQRGCSLPSDPQGWRLCGTVH
jgi:hypothetical protein